MKKGKIKKENQKSINDNSIYYDNDKPEANKIESMYFGMKTYGENLETGDISLKLSLKFDGESALKNNDFDLGYRREVKTLQSAINYISDLPGKKKVVYGNFPVYSAINFPNSGYMDNKNITPRMSFTNDLDYVIIDLLDTNSDMNEYRSRLRLVQTFTDGYAKAGVFQVIK